MTGINARARAIGIKTQDSWPYGPNVNVDMRLALLGWAEHYRLTIATGYRHKRFLCYGRNSDGKKHDIYAETYGGLCCRRGWFDHVTCWNRNGKPALILSQPYSLCDSDIFDLRELRKRDHVIFRLDVGWYAAGGVSTFAIEVWSRQVWEQITDEGIQPYEYPGHIYLQCGLFEDKVADWSPLSLTTRDT
jgi:hypothetical protein